MNLGTRETVDKPTEGVKTLDVLYQSSDLYAPMAGVSMVSLMENNKEINEINIYLMGSGISDLNMSKFKKACDSYGRCLSVICTKEVKHELQSVWRVPTVRGSLATYFKLMAIVRLSIAADRVLYIDADTIVVGSLIPLVDMSFDGNLMAGCLSVSAPRARKISGLSPKGKWFNSGVILFNRYLWLHENCEEQIVEHMMSLQRPYTIADESILNVLFGHRIKLLDMKYNFQSYTYFYGIKHALGIYGLNADNFYDIDHVSEAYYSPVIHHTVGSLTGRPCHLNNLHPLNSLFDKYLSISPWHDWEKMEAKGRLADSIQRALYNALPRSMYVPIHRTYVSYKWRKEHKPLQIISRLR